MTTMTADQHVAEVFEGRGVAIHVAPEGVALSGPTVAERDPFSLVAEYSEMTEARVEGGARARLIVEFRDTREPWIVGGMRRSHALWAQRLIHDHLRREECRGLPIFSERLSAEKFVEAVGALLDRGYADIPDLAHALLTQAALRRASDLHLVPGGEGLRAQWRVDGVLADACRLPPDIGQRVVARLKVLAGLMGYRHDIIQEGRFVLDLGSPVEMRLTVMPTLHGESATVRIYRPDGDIIPLDELGFEPEDLEAYRALIVQPHGLVILTGPAGAGKTTTMCASLKDLHERSGGGLSFATVEEPVEHDLGFAAQTAVDAAAGLDFATTLRATLRRDPNVIMVGEIRDPATAETAVRAGMTGHLVFTTLHAAGAAGVFPRLAELGVAPSLAASALRGIVSQRLLRRLCSCAEAAAPDDDLLRSLGLEGHDIAGWRLKAPRGCTQCDGTGHAGRVGVFQLALVGPDMVTLALRGASGQEFDAALAAQQVPDLHDRALRKARAGLVALDEIARVLGSRP